MDDLYKVMFYGKLQPNYEIEKVVSNLSQLFRIPEDKAEIFVSSQKARVIKKGLSYEMALKYRKKLEEAGLLVEVKSESQEQVNTLSSQVPLEEQEKIDNLGKKESTRETVRSQEHLREKEAELGKYIVRFSIIYVGLVIGVSIVMALLPFDSRSGGTVVALICAAMFTVIRFIKDHKRVPNRSEKNRLTWLSLLASWGISLIFVGIFVAISDELRQLAGQIKSINFALVFGIFSVVFIVSSLISFASLYMTYGFIARKQFQILQKKGKI